MNIPLAGLAPFAIGDSISGIAGCAVTGVRSGRIMVTPPIMVEILAI